VSWRQEPVVDSTEDDVIAPPQKPRWLQFSLRSLLAAMLLAGLLLGRYGMRQYELSREKAALAELQTYGADVQFHKGRVVGLSFSGAGFEESALALLDRLPQLERLVFIDARLGDAGLESISQLEDLKQLLLFDAAVTDRGLAHLERLPNLTTLRLENVQIGDEGLKHVARIRSLERLDLPGTDVSDAGLESLAQLRGLKQLYLNGTQVTDAGVEALKSRLPETKIVY
jgi:hypothetical protein